MGIEWVPWDEPLYRRVQTLVAGIQMYSLLFGELICLYIFIFALVSYQINMLYDKMT